MMVRHATSAAIPDSYWRLVQEHPLCSITTRRQLVAAQRMIDSLLARDLDSGGEQYLSALTDLVESYENRLPPLQRPSSHQMLAFLIDAQSTTQNELAAGAGIAKSTISEILAGKRRPTVRHIQKFAQFFHVDPGVFLRDAEST